jgi:AcrR family transcriptional regulator
MARADRRRQLLQIARDLIEAGGLRALTMTALAEQAQIAKPVIYTHFSSRQDVAVALVEAHFQALRAFFESRLNSETTLSSYIEYVVEAAFAFEDASKIPIRKITNGFSAGDEVNRIFVGEQDEFRDHWRRLLGLLGAPPLRAEVGATFLFEMVNAAAHAFAATRQKDEACSTLSTLLMSALKSIAVGDGPTPADFGQFDGPVHDAIARAAKNPSRP